MSCSIICFLFVMRIFEVIIFYFKGGWAVWCCWSSSSKKIKIRYQLNALFILPNGQSKGIPVSL
jgi:hypothetical protein